jgi:hypothetical protein
MIPFKKIGMRRIGYNKPVILQPPASARTRRTGKAAEILADMKIDEDWFAG